jgi:hypothetical protein
MKDQLSLSRLRLSRRLTYTKMQSKKYSSLGMGDELRQLRKNQIAMMEFLLTLRA